MGMVAILVMRPRPYKQTFVPSPYAGAICNLVSIGPVVSEEMSFEDVENSDAATTIDDETQLIL